MCGGYDAAYYLAVGKGSCGVVDADDVGGDVGGHGEGTGYGGCACRASGLDDKGSGDAGGHGDGGHPRTDGHTDDVVGLGGGTYGVEGVGYHCSPRHGAVLFGEGAAEAGACPAGNDDMESHMMVDLKIPRDDEARGIVWIASGRFPQGLANDDLVYLRALAHDIDTGGEVSALRHTDTLDVEDLGRPVDLNLNLLDSRRVVVVSLHIELGHD